MAVSRVTPGDVTQRLRSEVRRIAAEQGYGKQLTPYVQLKRGAPTTKALSLVSTN